MIRNLLISGAMVLIAPAIGLAQPGPAMKAKPAMPAAMPAPTSANYMKMAGQSDVFEIQSGKLAAKKAQSPALKQFGSEMVTDHMKSTQMVMDAAKKSGMPAGAPPPLPADKMKMIASLKTMSGAAFDKAYLMQQRNAHQDALALQTSYANGGGDPNLKAAAAQIVPVVQMHIDMLGKM